jgi:alkanesulfonate monooxygenase SsuD/methylene tetrahydromethanopterin reductase-like flavin-dependent oxidoreductase (luciferase family)
VPRPLAVGVQLPEVERKVLWPEVRDMAVTAEDVGFDSLWVGDHLLYRSDGIATGPWEAWSMLAAIAAVTERVQIGPLVAATSFHSPAMLAKKAATVDEISNGRLILGLGAGWNQIEFEGFGYPFDHRASRFEEAFTIIRTLLTDGAIDFDGEYYTLRDCELVPPARPGGIPLMIGSDGPRVLAATLPYVDGWNAWHAWYDNGPDGARQLLERIDAACVDVGRDPKTLDRSLAVFVRAPGGSYGMRQGSPNRPSSFAVEGDQAAIAEHIIKLSALGVSHVQLVVDPITADSIGWLGGVLSILDSNR